IITTVRSSVPLIVELAVAWRMFTIFFQAEDGIRGRNVTGVQTCVLPILLPQIYQVKTELKKFCLKKSEVIDKSNSMSIMSFATTDLYPHSVQSKTGGWRLKKIASSSIAKWKQIFRASTQQETLIHTLEKSN